MSQRIADTGNRCYEVGSGAQVQPLPQALHALPLLAEGVLALAVVALAQPQDLAGFQLHLLHQQASSVSHTWLMCRHDTAGKQWTSGMQHNIHHVAV